MFNLYINDANNEERTITVADPADSKVAKRLAKKVKGWFAALETHTLDTNVECLHVNQLIAVAALEHERGVEGFDILTRLLQDCYPHFSVSLTSVMESLCTVEIFVRHGQFGKVVPIGLNNVAKLLPHEQLSSVIFGEAWSGANTDVFKTLTDNVVDPLIAGVAGDNRNITAVVTLGNRTAIVDVSDRGHVFATSPTTAHTETLSLLSDGKLVTIQLKYTE